MDFIFCQKVTPNTAMKQLNKQKAEKPCRYVELYKRVEIMYNYEITRVRSVSYDTAARTLFSCHHGDPVPGINTPVWTPFVVKAMKS